MTGVRRSPKITVADLHGNVVTGRYVSRKSIGADGEICHVVLERDNGSRFRIIALTRSVVGALEGLNL